MRTAISIYCTETGQHLKRKFETYYGVGSYKHFHYCKCHNKLCIARCIECGPIAYSNSSKHEKRLRGHTIAREICENTPQKMKRKGSNGISMPLSIPFILPSFRFQSNIYCGEWSRIERVDPQNFACKDLLTAFIKKWISFDHYDGIAPLILSEKWNLLDIQKLFEILRACIETNDRKRWDREGMPLMLKLNEELIVTYEMDYENNMFNVQ